jgi:transcriptional regulator EpsA
MAFDSNLNDDERELLLELVHQSLQVQSHLDLFVWLQGKLQKFLPHEVLIAAWGDFSLGLVYFDIVSSLPGLRTNSRSQSDLSPLLKRLFSFWSSHQQSPFTIKIENSCFIEDVLEYNLADDNLSNMKSAVIHGIKDCRGHHDCLYVLMNSEAIPTSSGKMLEALLPYIDCALRQLDHLPQQLPEEEPMNKLTEENVNKLTQENVADTLISAREIEIMDWVKQGKTNMEIGLILNISAFTVKNHLQRIFKKLDVLNRAQAVSKYKQVFQIQ